jgi:hypothetical protein
VPLNRRSCTFYYSVFVLDYGARFVLDCGARFVLDYGIRRFMLDLVDAMYRGFPPLIAGWRRLACRLTGCGLTWYLPCAALPR